MAKIQIKTSKPFVERKVQAKSLKESIIIGVRSYPEKEMAEIRKEYLANFSTVKLSRWVKELEELRENTSLSETVFDEKVSFLENAIAEKNQSFASFQNEFCHKHIVYIKNASLSLEENGKKTDLLIPDTREVKPIESLWETPEECLVVLLDMYLDSTSYQDSLYSATPSAVFNTDFKGEELKN